jgi:hypothetical protein
MEGKRQRAESREGMKVTTIALPAEVHRQLAIAALERNTVLTELVRQAVVDWLARHAKSGRRKP